MPTADAPQMVKHVADEQAQPSCRLSQRSPSAEVSAFPYRAATRKIPRKDTSRSLNSLLYRRMKRGIDIIGGVTGLILFSPVMAVALVLVWLEDGGPVIFRQRRVGEKGKVFLFYKIRTMCKDAEVRLAEVAAFNHHIDERTFKAKNDPRLLRVGKFLRRYSIDEFPQLLNVISGEMSLVGPRPPIPREVDLYDPEDFVRFLVKPGLTCYWQVSGRGCVPFKEQVELDRRYIRDCSVWVDLKIILKTLPAMLKGEGAH